MIMQWKNGSCTNSPGDWRCYVERTPRFDWAYIAERMGDRVTGRVEASGFLTARAAQLSCEAALVRLGILPLPCRWTKHGRHLEYHHIGEPTYRAEVSLWRGLGRLTWLHVGNGPHAMAACDLHLRGSWETVDAAKAAAERHLRAELAAWLDAQAAKEGAL